MVEERNNENTEQELFEHFRILTDKGQTPLRIDKFLVNRLENTSRTRIQNAAEAGNILVNNKIIKSNYKIKPGDEISILLAYPPNVTEIVPEDIPLDIVYEDNDLIVINKKPDMVVHPGLGNYNGTLLNAIAFHCPEAPLFSKEDLRPGLVHRLDKDTSGLMVIAKNEFTLNKLAKQFFDRTVKRCYNALVWGNFDEEEGTVTGHVGRNLKDRMTMNVFSDGSHGKHAVTHYKLIERIGYVSLVECTLETGRTHQIRVHMKHIGHPVFGDEKYGGKEILKGTTFPKYKQFVMNCFKMLPRQALHAKTLGFFHPVLKKEVFFETTLPDDMQGVIDKWRRYIAGREEN